MKKDMMLGLTDGSGKLRKAVYKMISGNMRNCDDELVQHLNCHTKQSAMEGPEPIRDSKTQYFLLTQSNSDTRGHL